MNNTRMYQIVSMTQASFIRARMRFDRQRVQQMQMQQPPLQMQAVPQAVPQALAIANNGNDAVAAIADAGFQGADAVVAAANAIAAPQVEGDSIAAQVDAAPAAPQPLTSSSIGSTTATSSTTSESEPDDERAPKRIRIGI